MISNLSTAQQSCCLSPSRPAHSSTLLESNSSVSCSSGFLEPCSPSPILRAPPSVLRIFAPVSLLHEIVLLLYLNHVPSPPSGFLLPFSFHVSSSHLSPSDLPIISRLPSEDGSPTGIGLFVLFTARPPEPRTEPGTQETLSKCLSNRGEADLNQHSSPRI